MLTTKRVAIALSREPGRRSWSGKALRQGAEQPQSKPFCMACSSSHPYLLFERKKRRKKRRKKKRRKTMMMRKKKMNSS